jgi:hypothetical protein
MASFRINYILTKAARWKISFINQLPSWVLLSLVFTVNNRSVIYPAIIIGFILSIAFAYFPFYTNAKLIVQDNALQLVTASGRHTIEADTIRQISFHTGDSEDSANQVKCTIERINEPPVQFYIGRLGFKGMIRRTDELISVLLAKPEFNNKLKEVRPDEKNTL